MLPRKVINKPEDNRLKNEGNIINSINKIETNTNLRYLLKKRFSFVEKHISENDKILELGAGAGHSKKFIKHKNLKISDVTSYDFLDYKNVNALATPFKKESFDVVFSLSMIHHVPNPIRLFNEIGRILKKNGRYIILDINCSFFYKLVTILTKVECYNLDVDIYNKDISLTNPENPFDSNNAVPSLIFNDFEKFNSKLDFSFELSEFKYEELLVFLNSGGVITEAPHIPLNNFFLKAFDKLDMLLAKLNKIFPLHLYACLTKK